MTDLSVVFLLHSPVGRDYCRLIFYCYVYFPAMHLHLYPIRCWVWVPGKDCFHPLCSTNQLPAWPHGESFSDPFFYFHRVMNHRYAFAILHRSLNSLHRLQCPMVLLQALCIPISLCFLLPSVVL